MRKHLLKTLAFCAACTVAAAQAQTSSSGSSSSDTTGSSPGTSGSSSSGLNDSSSSGLSGAPRHHSDLGGQFSPTGRMSHQDVRGSQLTGAQVNGSSGNQLGTISDVIINPASGRVDFAVLSVNSSAGNNSSGINSSTSSSSTAASSTGAGGKQVVVPWMLLRPSSGSASSGTSAQQSFQFAGDNSKLDSAPSFDANTDLSQPSWRQSVYSYFGLSGRGSIGAAESQSGTYGGSSSSAPESSGSSSSPGSSFSGSSTDNSSAGSSSWQRQ